MGDGGDGAATGGSGRQEGLEGLGVCVAGNGVRVAGVAVLTAGLDSLHIRCWRLRSPKVTPMSNGEALDPESLVVELDDELALVALELNFPVVHFPMMVRAEDHDVARLKGAHLER